MTQSQDPLADIEFFQQLKANKIKSPNEFTIKMGQLIRQAREDKGMSQVELGDEISRRPATISAIENGKSEIGVLTLVLFAIVLEKPISYFFPPSLLKDLVVDVKTQFQHDVLDIARDIENGGDLDLTISILKILRDRFDDYIDAAEQKHSSYPE